MHKQIVKTVLCWTKLGEKRVCCGRILFSCCFVLMKLFIHLGLHRTGTHNIRFHLWEKHPQINYLGRISRGSGEKHLELTELASQPSEATTLVISSAGVVGTR